VARVCDVRILVGHRPPFCHARLRAVPLERIEVHPDNFGVLATYCPPVPRGRSLRRRLRDWWCPTKTTFVVVEIDNIREEAAGDYRER